MISRWIKKSASKYPPAAPELHPNSGVGGWLLFLILILMFLGPVIGFARTSSNFASIELQYPNIVSLTEWKIFKTTTWATFITTSFLSIYAGYVLNLKRKKLAIRRAIIVIWIINPVYIFIIGVLLPSLAFGETSIDSQTSGALIGATINSTIWTLYLNKSKRVKATYGREIE
jgi:hypothetical protein